MTRIYSTNSFLQDISPNLDLFITKIIALLRNILHKIYKVTNSEMEVGIVEFIIQIPMLIFILVLGLFMFLVLLNNSEPANGYRVSSVLSSSMEPSIKTGSMVFLTPPIEIRIGDIVLFSEKSSISGNTTGRRLIHRIIEEKLVNGQRVYITKGDANSFPDPGYLHINNIHSKVLIAIPYIGFLGALLQTKWGLLTFFLVPIWVLIYSEVKVIRRHYTTK